MVDLYDGIVLIDKRGGKTSFDVVKTVRKILRIKKVGHAGTLDPFATGLLVILLGQGTKLSPYLMSGEKIYRATMRLGVETDTQDPTGRVIQTKTVPDLEPEYIREKTLGFLGEVEQVPPIFSAVKYKGKRAYELARKGLKVELKKRKVRISSLKVLTVDLPDVIMEITCSGGTYIRSLAADLGRQFGTGAHLKALRRLSSGPFAVKDAMNLIELAFRFSNSAPKDTIIPLREALPTVKESEVDNRMALKIRNGYQPEWGELFQGSDLTDGFEGYMKLVTAMELVAIVKVGNILGAEGGSLKIMRVFN